MAIKLDYFKPEYLPKPNDEHYESFIIGVNKKGKEIHFSCNPEKLANNFGANPDNPYYLTKVFFDRKVLSGYYEEPSKYSIKDGYLSCGTLWGIRIDNNNEKYVIAFLGDLGRDLPLSHRKYWRSFNVVPDGSLSEVEFRRSFLAEFTDPSSQDLVFKQKLNQHRESWKKKFNWDLLKDLNEKDRFHLVALRIPMKDEQMEFDAQILSLTKILIDSINESEISTKISKGKGDTGITKLEKFFSENNFKEYEKYIKFLRSLQDLRSKVVHRKASRYDQEYDQILKNLEIKTNNLTLIFKDILNLAINYLEYLINLCK